jgi:hypothetical protein
MACSRTGRMAYSSNSVPSANEGYLGEELAKICEDTVRATGESLL